jgi:phosphatidylserine decarboxylase
LLKSLFNVFVELTSSKWMSKLLKKFAQSKVSKPFNALFVKVYNINKDEMELPLHEYNSLHELFTRKLKNGARTFDLNPSSLISPVDGHISSFGKINGNTIFEVKHTQLHIEEMLGKETDIKKYIHGSYIILYLSPQNYHRIHSPMEGTIQKQWTLGGKSYPVNRTGLKFGKRPLSTNYRVITELNSPFGNVAIVKVGALNVNSIHLLHEGNELHTGDELAYFSFGSTVVLLIENPNFAFASTIKENMEIRLGQKLGNFVEH